MRLCGLTGVCGKGWVFAPPPASSVLPNLDISNFNPNTLPDSATSLPAAPQQEEQMALARSAGGGDLNKLMSKRALDLFRHMCRQSAAVAISYELNYTAAEVRHFVSFFLPCPLSR